MFLGVVHRIDRPVSGVIIFAKTSKALSRLNTLFREKKIKKTYLAIVKNKPSPTKNTLIHYLKKNKLKNKSSAFKKSVEGSLKSELEYELIKSLDNYYLLKITPKTGRHHQIRVQLSTIGCPIKGDLKYGAKRSNKNASINLHAYKVEFTHPFYDMKTINAQKYCNLNTKFPIPALLSLLIFLFLRIAGPKKRFAFGFSDICKTWLQRKKNPKSSSPNCEISIAW